MAFLHTISLLHVLSGLSVGFLVGLTGVGGGSLMTPLLILLFGVQPVTAVGTDLLYACATKTAGSLVHSFNRTINWKVVRRLATGSVPATVATLLTLHYLGIGSSGANVLVTKALGVALLLTSTALIFRRRLIAAFAARVGALSPSLTRALTIATGAFLGIVVSLSSVGAGALGVTALILLYPELPAATIAGSDLVHAVPLTLVSGAGHWFLGSIDIHLLGSLLIGSIPGIVAGSLLAPRMPEHALRLTLAATLIAVAAKLLIAS